MRRRAFTLIEALVVSGIFLFVVWMAFAIFQFGAQACRVSNTRANVQTAATRVMLSLQNDLRRSSRPTVDMVARAVPFASGKFRRDAVSMAAVGDWTAPSSLNVQFGNPNFDRYMVYYASSDTEDGKLYRSVVNNTASGDVFQVLPNFNEAVRFNNNPTLNNPEQTVYTMLSDEVREFKVEPGSSSKSVQATLILFQQGGRGPTEGGKQMNQAFEMRIDLVPQNTPRGN